MLGGDNLNNIGLDVQDGSHLGWLQGSYLVAEDNGGLNSVSIGDGFDCERLYIDKVRLLLDDSLDNGGSFFRSNDLLIIIGDNLDLTEFVLKCNGFDLNVFLVLFFFLFNIVDNDL